MNWRHTHMLDRPNKRRPKIILLFEGAILALVVCGLFLPPQFMLAVIGLYAGAVCWWLREEYLGPYRDDWT
jgi:hypothetical protein